MSRQAMLTLAAASISLCTPVVSQFRTELGDSVEVTRSSKGEETYRIASDSGSIERKADTQLRFAYHPYDPLIASDDVPRGLRSRASDRLKVVQFWTTPLEAYRRVISRLGGSIRKYVPGQAYVVEASDGAFSDISRQPFVRSIGSYHPAYRLSAAIHDALKGASMGAKRYSLLLFEAGADTKSLVSSRIRLLGGAIDDDGPDGHIVEATLSREQLLEVAHWDEVMFIDIWSPGEYDLNIARQISGTNDLETVAGFSGQGVRGQVRDGGVRETHDSFDSRPLIILSNTVDTAHGTSTTGIVFGDGTGNASGRGILPSGQGIFRSGLATGATRYSQTAALVNTYQGVFESNSTGSALTASYGAESANLDDIIFDLDILICQSQSNNGNQLSRPQAWAKNIVSVGGISHLNTLTTADDMWTTASIGPASDGRLKPDLSHFYDSILCPTDTNDTAYTAGFGGTSGATPITSGHFGLLYQMWAAGVFGNTVTGSDVFTSRCHAMTAKALMINTAQQWPFSGSGANLSRYKQGWGRAQVKRLYDLRNKMVVRDEEDVLQPFQTMTRRVYVSPGEPEFKVTMSYRDPMGNPAIQAQHRVNDLSLTVVSPSGNTYYGNGGLSSGNYSTAGGSANTKDTVENVFVFQPESGVWTITVAADEIVEDAYVSDGAMNASFSLVASGVTEVLAPTYTLLTGAVSGGTFGSMAMSDNARLVLTPGPVLTSAAPPVVLQADMVSPIQSPSELRIKLETSATLGNLAQRVQALNVNTGLYEDVDTTTVTTFDSAREVVLLAPANYVGGGGLIKCRITWKPAGPTLIFPWNTSVDQVRITVLP